MSADVCRWNERCFLNRLYSGPYALYTSPEEKGLSDGTEMKTSRGWAGKLECKGEQINVQDGVVTRGGMNSGGMNSDSVKWVKGYRMQDCKYVLTPRS